MIKGISWCWFRVVLLLRCNGISFGDKVFIGGFGESGLFFLRWMIIKYWYDIWDEDYYFSWDFILMDFVGLEFVDLFLFYNREMV